MFRVGVALLAVGASNPFFIFSNISWKVCDKNL